MQTVHIRNGFDDRLERQKIVRRHERVVALKTNLILPGSSLVVRTQRLDAHSLHRQTDVSAHVLALVKRRDVKITRFVVRLQSRLAALVCLK